MFLTVRGCSEVTEQHDHPLSKGMFSLGHNLTLILPNLVLLHNFHSGNFYRLDVLNHEATIMENLTVFM